MDRTRYLVLLLIVILLAFTLRVTDLTQIPPGLTHDEANHGREAIGILDSVLLFYFPLNYGSEPLYSYTVAGSMALLGANQFSLRLVNVVFSIGAMVIAYLWTARVFDRRTALLAMALTAVSFWPLASSREALRAGMLPFFFASAVWFFWQLLSRRDARDAQMAARRLWILLGFSLSVAATLHIYLAARVAWLVFPAFLLYLALYHRETLRRAWIPTLAGLLLAGLMVTPMFLYLRGHPEVLTRLDMLDGPLNSLSEGNLRPVLVNAGKALLAFIWPGYGDKFLAYNIPGRPVFDAFTAVFFVVGIAVSFWRWKQPRYAFLLLWFMVGISPSLITGPTANTTRNLAAISAAHLLPAIGILSLFAAVRSANGLIRRILPSLVATTWILLVGWTTARDYFVTWAESPEVRGAYQHTLIQSLAYLQDSAIPPPIVISSVYPGPAHDPSIGLVVLPQSELATRWVDARYAYLFPGGQDSTAIIPSSTPAHPLFREFLLEKEMVWLRPGDLDPFFRVYQSEAAKIQDWPLNEGVDFDGAIVLLHSRWHFPAVQPGETAELLTIWRVSNPDRIGPKVLPLNMTDVVLFTQVLDGEGQVLAQRDSLEAPTWDWESGDIVLQVHPVAVPDDVLPGEYQTIVGWYDRLSKARRPVIDETGTVVDDRSFVTPLHVEG